MFESKVIAVDFDGTIVQDAYPKIGKPMLFAFETLRQMQDAGHRLILWTYRSGKRLDEAVAFCKEHGIEFYAVNKSFPEEPDELDGKISRKIHADLFIDDRNVGGFPGWGEIWQTLNGNGMINADMEKKLKKKKKGLFSRR